MIKPDAMQRGLVGDIITKFQKRGFTLIATKVTQPGRAHFEEHYAEHKGRDFFNKLVTFASSGPVVAMVWEGDDIIATSRTMIGATNPANAATGTIRDLYGLCQGRNAVHGSDSVESANREIALWFKPEEIYAYDHHNEKWVYEKVQEVAPVQKKEEVPALVEAPVVEEKVFEAVVEEKAAEPVAEEKVPEVE